MRPLRFAWRWLRWMTSFLLAVAAVLFLIPYLLLRRRGALLAVIPANRITDEDRGVKR